MHHSDRGVQYVCTDSAARLAAHPAEHEPDWQSYNNAKAEASANQRRKRSMAEPIGDIIYAKKSIGELIGRVYNRQPAIPPSTISGRMNTKLNLTPLRHDPQPQSKT
ncbi:MAG: hypothetical protein E5W81_14515 [Mesorhizobium sp.]|nr:MAG: hypothetical protein E5W81_14515 [Mesorhizobium sp.]